MVTAADDFTLKGFAAIRDFQVVGDDAGDKVGGNEILFAGVEVVGDGDFTVYLKGSYDNV